MSDFSNAPSVRIQPPRRSATLPSKLSLQKQRSSDSLRPSEDDLFFHPCAKVVHFAPRALAPIPSSTAPSDFDYPVDTIETLPWRSPTERTVAFAPLRLQNVHGLTVFLKCGGVVHAILKNSQCWCVDGESTFVLRVRPLTYYRIELPSSTENNENYVIQLKNVLPRILRYEITPCPFQRGFTVEIPEEFKMKKRRKAWRPKGRRESAPASSTASQGSSPKGDEDGCKGISVMKRGSACTVLETIPDENQLLSPTSVPEGWNIPRRSITDTQSFQTLLARFDNTKAESQVDPDTSYSSSADSFHSMDDYMHPESSARSTSTSPSSVDHNELDQDQHYEPGKFFKDVDYSDNRPSTSYSDGSLSQAPESPTTRRKPESTPLKIPATSTEKPSALSPIEANKDKMSREFRRRAKASTEREISPMPPPSALRRSNSFRKNDAKSIVQKTCTVVLVPSVQLLIILIHIAAQIVIGPALISMGEAHQGLEYQAPDSEDTVDDFDLPLQRSDSQDKKYDVWALD
ncbi:uncharacterized protein ACHE_40474S [Aspergillus chevalieri]|uniref:Inheritance of peroxisomes protein 1 n=1 Tax=Aspergillus chevalieri TaxID=182096 RepID=A0A7R7VNL7_ASPCH|nr:uncharacterized protein ACHE_40474S [Aspergillus chevalieri]BCR87910.1 hypothetical protein ACHE_40474S [Aspergillus chevalieri]